MKFRINIQRDSATPTYRQLCDQIIHLIQSDDFQIGEFLPTENQIGEISGLSRMTVRKAVERLTRLGLVEAVRGRGTFIVAKEPTTKEKKSIGFVLRPHRYIEEDPFYAQILMGVTQEAQKKRIHLAFVSGEQLDNQEHLAEHDQLLRSLCGVLIAGQMPEPFLDHIQKSCIPSVFLNYRSSLYPFDTVTADQRETGRLLGQHLVELGHKRCLYLSGEPNNIAYEERLAGFREVFTRDSVRELSILKGGKKTESGREMIRKALEQNLAFTAVATGNDMMAIGAMNELQDRGFRIPEEFSVCGIDNVAFAENCRPTLTTVHIEKQEMGVKAMKVLLDRLRNPQKVQETILLGVHLCIRQSTGPAPGVTPAIAMQDACTTIP